MSNQNITTLTLRADLLKDMDMLRNGEISVSQARTRAALARAICDTIKIELVAANLVNKKISSVLLVEREIRAVAA